MALHFNVRQRVAKQRMSVRVGTAVVEDTFCGHTALTELQGYVHYPRSPRFPGREKKIAIERSKTTVLVDQIPGSCLHARTLNNCTHVKGALTYRKATPCG